MAGRFWQKDEGKWPGRVESRFRDVSVKARECNTFVNCSKCGWVATDKVEFLGVESDFEGRDTMEFTCGCGETRKSLVVRGRPG